MVVIGAGEAGSSFWAGIAITAAIFGLFGAFGYGVWRMVDPDRWVERDSGERSRLSLWDHARAVIWWTLVVAAVVGLLSVIGFLTEGKEKPQSDLVFIGLLLVAFLVVAMVAWCKRCPETGERVLLCHCPQHSGE